MLNESNETTNHNNMKYLTVSPLSKLLLVLVATHLVIENAITENPSQATTNSFLPTTTILPPTRKSPTNIDIINSNDQTDSSSTSNEQQQFIASIPQQQTTLQQLVAGGSQQQQATTLSATTLSATTPESTLSMNTQQPVNNQKNYLEQQKNADVKVQYLTPVSLANTLRTTTTDLRDITTGR